MEEDANRAPGAPHPPGDLRGAHLIDEAQDERAAAIARQAADGTPGLGRLVPADSLTLDVLRVGDDRRRGWVKECRGMPARRSSLVGDDVSRDSEEPDLERRRPRAILGLRARPPPPSGPV